MATVLHTALFGCLRTNYNVYHFKTQYISLKIDTTVYNTYANIPFSSCINEIKENISSEQWEKETKIYDIATDVLQNIMTLLCFALIDPIMYQMCLYFTETTYKPSYWQLYDMFFWLIKCHAVINFRISQWQSDLLLGDGWGEMGRQGRVVLHRMNSWDVWCPGLLNHYSELRT